MKPDTAAQELWAVCKAKGKEIAGDFGIGRGRSCLDRAGGACQVPDEEDGRYEPKQAYL